MAKTKAKAKVKTEVKNNAKAAPNKATVKKGVPAKKAVPLKKVVNKSKPPSKKIVTKKSISQKKVSKPVLKKAVKPILKRAVKPVLNKTVKPLLKLKSKVEKNLNLKAPEKKADKKTTVEKIIPKKVAAQTNDVIEKKIKFEFPKKRAGRKPKNKGDEDDGFELIEVPKLEPINKKTPKKKFVIPVNPDVYINPFAKLVVAPKNMGTYKKFEIEFPIHASPYIIYSFISTPAGLSEWFAENVNVRNDEYTFLWDGSQQTATLLSKKENTFMKFRWNDEPDFTFFEFRIVVDEITQDVAFWVTDFAEDEKSKEASEMLWHSQIDALIHAMGA